jgi:hypothetical protein
MYAPEQVMGVAKEALWEGNLTPETQRRELCHFFYPAPPEEPSFARWKASGAPAQLHFYVRLIDAFGWDARKQVLATYQTDPILYAQDELAAGDEGERRGEVRCWDEWYRRYSRVTALNLLSYFAAWQFPIRSWRGARSQRSDCRAGTGRCRRARAADCSGPAAVSARSPAFRGAPRHTGQVTQGQLLRYSGFESRAKCYAARQ